jgi:uncharacterized membrane protein YeaQ/YmgE (transglycosylase-associated protein family)
VALKRRSDMLNLIGTAVFGLIVGALAKVVMPGKDPGGILMTMVLGVAGALVGSLIGRAIGLYAPGDAAGFIMATLGAVVLLFAYRKIAAKPA